MNRSSDEFAKNVCDALGFFLRGQLPATALRDIATALEKGSNAALSAGFELGRSRPWNSPPLLTRDYTRKLK